MAENVQHAIPDKKEEPEAANEWEPKVIGFLCNWCSYAGADLCGVSRYQYPTNIRSVRVMCSTRISPHIVLDLFEAGADGILIGSPTYFADVSSETKALIDRSGFVGMANGGLYTRKVGAAIVAVRRAGGIHAFDTINHFFGISGMYTVGSTYWNLGIGLHPGEVEQDGEGIGIMRNLGANMAWILKKIHQH